MSRSLRSKSPTSWSTPSRMADSRYFLTNPRAMRCGLGSTGSSTVTCSACTCPARNSESASGRRTRGERLEPRAVAHVHVQPHVLSQLAPCFGIVDERPDDADCGRSVLLVDGYVHRPEAHAVVIEPVVARQHVDHQFAEVGELCLAGERRNSAIQPERTAPAQELLEIAEGLEVRFELKRTHDGHLARLT